MFLAILGNQDSRVAVGAPGAGPTLAFQAVAGGKTVALPWTNVKRLALMLVLAVPGCFYVDPINQRPSVTIREQTEGTPFRGDSVELQAVSQDPDGDEVLYTWRTYACTTGDDPTPDCDAEPYDTSGLGDYFVTVPTTRIDGVTPVRALRVILDAKDAVGAVAKPEQQLVIPIGDHAPALEVRQDSRHDFVIDSHIALFADVADPDDGPDGVTLVWDVFSPATQPAFELLDASPPSHLPGHRGEAKSLVPHGTGSWDVRVTATDTLGQATVQDFVIVVATDEPPCIDASSPLAQAGETLPLFEATQFEIPVVTDDLDTYPPQLADADAGVAGFSWSLKTNAGARVPLAIAGNGVALDPTSFHSGDILELRVEITDRQPRQASFDACPDVDATCTFNPIDTSCAQRQTWRVEVQ